MKMLLNLRVTTEEYALASPLLNIKKVQAVDKNGMINFYVNAHEHYLRSKKTADKIKINYPKPENVIVAGMGGSAIGGELLKDWARNKTNVPIEVSREYSLPAYANEKTLVLVTSYSGGTEEALSSLLDALKKNVWFTVLVQAEN
jgi:glucose/mannose-6-phosphate isomerase